MELTKAYLLKKRYKVDMPSLERRLILFFEKDKKKIGRSQRTHDTFIKDRAYAQALSDVVSMILGETRKEARERVSYYEE